MDALCLDVETHLRRNAKSLGPLSYCLDDERKANVAGSYPAGLAVVAIGAAGGGWVPAGGRYVLFRKPSTGAGFATAIIGTGVGTITADLAEAIDASWDVVDVRIVIPDVQYQTLDPGRPDDGRHECWRPRVVYRFLGGGEPLDRGGGRPRPRHGVRRRWRSSSPAPSPPPTRRPGPAPGSPLVLGTSPALIYGNAGHCGTIAQERIFRATAFPQTPNHKALVTLTWKNAAGAGRIAGIALRASSDGLDAYLFELDSNVGAARVRIRRRRNGMVTDLTGWIDVSGLALLRGLRGAQRRRHHDRPDREHRGGEGEPAALARRLEREPLRRGRRHERRPDRLGRERWALHRPASRRSTTSSTTSSRSATSRTSTRARPRSSTSGSRSSSTGPPTRGTSSSRRG